MVRSDSAAGSLRPEASHYALLRRTCANRGDCDAPTTPNKEIRIASNLRGEERLEVLIHEMVHAAGWHIDETFVEQFASDAARALWRQGYREG
jgi:hypothetical protein